MSESVASARALAAGCSVSLILILLFTSAESVAESAAVAREGMIEMGHERPVSEGALDEITAMAPPLPSLVRPAAEARMTPDERQRLAEVDALTAGAHAKIGVSGSGFPDTATRAGRPASALGSALAAPRAAVSGILGGLPAQASGPLP